MRGVRILTFVLPLLLLLAGSARVVLAWDKFDHEIFDLQSQLEVAEGKGTTFYSFMNITQKATTQEIERAFKKRGRQLHPDKNRGVKNAHDRFARLGVVANILRKRELREKYDFFHDNGFPRWRGTGYYYSRFRPGLGTVVVFLCLVTSLIQLLVQHITYRQDLARISRILTAARFVAWGPRFTPQKGRKKVRVPANGFPGMPAPATVGVELSPEKSKEALQAAAAGVEYEYRGRPLTCMVEGEKVFVVNEEDGEEWELDEQATTKPGLFTTTWSAKLVRWAADRTVCAGLRRAGLIKESQGLGEEEEEEQVEEEQVSETVSTSTPADSDRNATGESGTSTPVQGNGNGKPSSSAVSKSRAAKKRKGGKRK